MLIPNVRTREILKETQLFICEGESAYVKLTRNVSKPSTKLRKLGFLYNDEKNTTRRKKLYTKLKRQAALENYITENNFRELRVFKLCKLGL